ncbi:hypothetical protein SVI_2137 [Shewanella violacea DSS12]|uniref:Uncharacterized protein n=1 Tax=Shewanella violacea (strain JCM 10179 / CIP 106290 / LMG 19151 / DSS12) TaxID=637905 RepID=D4ZKA9_SHEVD|nr:hypothetical protein SVI_2137 [Shewanella violacea DSS12]
MPETMMNKGVQIIDDSDYWAGKLPISVKID